MFQPSVWWCEISSIPSMVEYPHGYASPLKREDLMLITVTKRDFMVLTRIYRKGCVERRVNEELIRTIPMLS